MAELTTEQLDVAKLIVNTLNLEDIVPENIDPKTPLFRDGIGLDSIDALELSLAIKQKYGLQLKADDDNIMQIFSSLATLTGYIQSHT
jgi:acyl carrier protein